MHLIQRHQAEVERALPRISIGKAAGKAGWAAELLWHASYHVQLEDGRRVDGGPFNNHFTIGSDDSVVAEDTPGNQYGVDFWLNDCKGNAVKTNPFTKQPSPHLVTIFGPGPPPSASPSPPASPSPALTPRSAPYWGDASDEGCKSPGYLQMSACLYGSSSRSNWNADCKGTPFSPNRYETLSASLLHFSADIKGAGANTQHFYQPDRCQNVKINIWGEFDYPDNSCCGNTGNPGGKHDELAGAGSRKLLVFPPRCDALTGPNLPITAAAFLLALLHSARDRAEIQLRNTAIQALQPPTNVAGRNPLTSTRFWERDVFVPGSNNRQFRDNFRVPVFQAFPASAPPINPPDYLPTQSDAFDATWVPRYTAGTGPLNNVLLTAQLTGCAFVWAYDSVNCVFYAAHINPDPTSPNNWARNGMALADALTFRAWSHGTELIANVYGRNGYGYVGTNGNIMAVRNGNGWEVIAQELGVNRSVPTDVHSVDYNDVQ
ncbi:hypothetical protein WJX74_001814 [Apatococcus lobatus]|uniref:Uncharacterized protein n=1 Tax=Apatococcus lobatus TaxID=904363 RepID=A0AAW1QY51_9CHLO